MGRPARTGLDRPGRHAASAECGSSTGCSTGFHEPRASHLDMLAAIAGTPLLERCYAAALDAGYLWHEFGDVNLLLP